MAVTDAQVRKLMTELEKHGELGKAAMRSGMDRKTARKFRDAGKLPSELKTPRTWRTRDDPFDEDWAYVRERLAQAPELEAKALFEHLCERNDGRYTEGQLRTLQRRLRRWRAQEGPPKEVFFSQEHRPGEAFQADFTSGNELGVTIGGERFLHLICQVVLPYSNWQWATVCRSESMMALRRGVQAALFRLGHRPQFLQTDNSTAATHSSRREDGCFTTWKEDGQPTSKRRFNERYIEFVRHFGLKPRTTGVGEKEQNGDVEALNGALKRRLKQHLLLRNSADFESVGAYERWIQEVLEKVNRMRTKRLGEELGVMPVLQAERVAEFVVEEVRVTLWSTLRVLHNTYSVPSRLQGELVEVRIYEDHLEVFHDGVLQLSCERLLGNHHARIDYRHMIESLVKKPGAFARYRFREAFFPSLAFRRAFDALHAGLKSTWQADLEYLRILHLAARTMEVEVEAVLVALLDAGEVPRFTRVETAVVPQRPAIPEQPAPKVDLKSYDGLLEGEVA